MKKLISALCALMLAVSLAACSRGPAEHGGLLPLDPTPAAAKGCFLRPGHRSFAEKGVYYKKSF